MVPKQWLGNTKKTNQVYVIASVTSALGGVIVNAPILKSASFLARLPMIKAFEVIVSHQTLLVKRMA